jgi:lipopolysaccharide transport system permease protein
LPGIDNRYAYAIYLMAGTLGWSLFAEIVQRSLMMFLDNRNIIKKLPFPRLALPVIVVGSALINNVLLLLAMVVIFASLGHMPSLTLLWLPLLIMLTVFLATSCGLILGLLNVFVRDLEQVVPLLMQFLFWLTPVVYMAQIIPERYRGLLQFNPLVPLITSYQDVLVYQVAPHVVNLLQTGLIAGLLCSFSLFIFHKGNAEMADLL